MGFVPVEVAAENPPLWSGKNSRKKGEGGFPQVCDDEDEENDEENNNDTTKSLKNYVDQRIFIGGLTQPSLPHSYDDGPLITIMP